MLEIEPSVKSLHFEAIKMSHLYTHSRLYDVRVSLNKSLLQIALCVFTFTHACTLRVFQRCAQFLTSKYEKKVKGGILHSDFRS